MIKGTCLCGSLGWSYASTPELVTACNCRACRRYGTLWAYGREGDGIQLSGPTVGYLREDGDKDLGFHFCPSCGCVGYWRAVSPDEEGRYRVAVNMRLAESPEQIFAVAIRHFDGFGSFKTLPGDGRCVKDMWY